MLKHVDEIVKTPYFGEKYDFHKEVLETYNASCVLPGLHALAKYCSVMVTRRGLQRTLIPMPGNPFSEDQIVAGVADGFEIMLSRYCNRTHFGLKLNPLHCFFFYEQSCKRRGHPYPLDVLKPVNSSWPTDVAANTLDKVVEELRNAGVSEDTWPSERALATFYSQLWAKTAPSTVPEGRSAQRKKRSDAGRKRTRDAGEVVLNNLPDPHDIDLDIFNL